MIGFIIVRDDGAFVADMRLSETGSSYTRSLQKARVYQTRNAADTNRCPGNERVVAVEELLPTPRDRD